MEKYDAQGKRILLSHGDGGALTKELINEIFFRNLKNDILEKEGDAACLPVLDGAPAMTTDSFVVNPVFFPGGDIGKLAVCGTVNDLAVSGAVPKYLTTGFMLEEGFPIDQLEQIVHSMSVAAKEAGVMVVAGDTKVVERGHLDGIFINTTGLGVLPPWANLGYHRISPGDKILINGGIGEHGVAVMAKREGFDFSVKSDCAALGNIIGLLLKKFKGVKFMRDPTRGGVATALKEIALSCGHDFYLNENSLPIDNEVRSICDLLGLDPLYLANEGKFLIVVDSEECEQIMNELCEHPLGRQSCCIGEVRAGKGNLLLKTAIGGTRRLELFAGAVLPRIC
ncbi:hydrogenase expression/formation protein HypE [Desulfosporosinus sp. Sb-LF]|nr:hydrogenase expression/formation protein HypE [Desulfosporosinus sp. Sb-LF]